MLKENALSGQNIIITGGGSGLGKSMALRFCELGASVVIAARKLERLEAAADEIRSKKSGAKVLAVQADVRDHDACERVAAKAAESFGSITGLVNNAAGNFLCAAEDLSQGGYDAVVDIVMKGSFNFTQAVGKKMIEQQSGGSVLSILTTYAWTGSAFVLPSAMAKAAVLIMTRSLAVEWGTAYGIRLNAIAPGPFPTEGAWSRLMPDPSLEESAKKRIPLGRFGEHVELTDLASYLISPFAGFINGECVTIDGGEWLKGAGEFNVYTDMDRDHVRQMLQSMRPKK